MTLRKIHKTPGMAPGIQGMEKGQPWTIPGNQFRNPLAGTAMQLQSIHTLIQSTTGKQSLSSLSPTSAGSEEPCLAASHQSTESSETARSGSNVQELATEYSTTAPLVVPEVAKVSSGGCFDTNNWVFRRVWKHTHHMDTEQLMKKYFYREDRGKYGEHHTSTRRAPDLGEFDEDAGTRAKGSDNHRYQERGRRVRHRCLQAESDQCISEFNMSIAQTELPEIKEEIRRTHEKQKACMSAGSDEHGRRHGGKAQAANAAKKLGKDDQLTAVLMSQYMGFILISRLQEKLNNARDEIEDADEKIDRLAKELQDIRLDQNQSQEEVKSIQDRTEAVNWRQRYEKSEAEKQSLEDEVSSLRRQVHENSRQGSMTPFMHGSLLPPPSIATQMGPMMPGMRGLPMSPILNHSASDMEQRKRKRAALEPPSIAIQINGQQRLPLSPAPSYDGSPSPSFYSS